MKHFTVWCPFFGQEESNANIFLAFNAQDAAEQWTKHHDWISAEYLIVGEQRVLIMVRDKTAHTLYRFNVLGESMPHCSVIEMRDTN